MNFAQAVNKMLQGKKVCLPAGTPGDYFKPDRYLHIVDKTIYYLDHPAHSSIGQEYINDSSWQIYMPDPKIKELEELKKQSTDLVKRQQELNDRIKKLESTP